MLERAFSELRTKPKSGNECQRTCARHEESHSVPSPPTAQAERPSHSQAAWTAQAAGAAQTALFLCQLVARII